MRIFILYPNYFVNRAVTHTCLSIASSLYKDGHFDISVMGMASDLPVKPVFYQDAIPALLQSAALKLFSRKQLTMWTEICFLSKLNNSDIVYLWPATSLSLFKKIKARGCTIVIENICRHQLISKRTLDDEYRRLDLPLIHTVDQKGVADETTKQEITDYIFSPSPAVTSSLIEANVPESKIINSSYGLTEAEILPVTSPNPSRETVFLFVARKLIIGKGIHLLLNYWSKANVNGKLKIVGGIDSKIENMIAPYYDDLSIEFIPFQKDQNDLKNIFKEADVFIFPSLEEGSPLVTYAALGASLPCLVSPMGGGGVIRHEKDGYIIEPHDEESWIKAIQELCNNNELRKKMSISAWEHAHDFLWDKVGERRSEQLRKRLNDDLDLC